MLRGDHADSAAHPRGGRGGGPLRGPAGEWHIDRTTRRVRPDGSGERHVDHVVVEHGTLPNDELYLDMVPHSANGGAVDHAALLAGDEEEVVAAVKRVPEVTLQI